MIVQDQEMCFEDLSFHRALFVLHGFLQGLNLRTGHFERSVPAGEVTFHLVWRDRCGVGFVKMLFQHMHHRVSDSMGDAGAFPKMFLSGRIFRHELRMMGSTAHLGNHETFSS